MSEIKDNGGPAYPAPDYIVNAELAKGEHIHRMGKTQGLSLRQYAAIKLKVPDSGTEWLDKMIIESLRNDFAAKAMQGLMTSQNQDGDWTHDVQMAAQIAYQVADAMLQARKP